MDEKEPSKTASDVNDIANRCMDSAGYLLFAAYLTPKRDNEGRPIIEFQYRRYHFPFEDAKTGIETLKGFVDREIQDLIDQFQEGQEDDKKS